MSRVMKPIQIPKPHRSGPVTFDDFCSLVEDGQKADLIDGVIYMSSPDNTDAARLFGWLYTILYDFCEHSDIGDVLGSRVALKFDDKNSPEPDILVVLKDHSDRIERGHVRGAADLAIEIVSPESVSRDYDKKRNLYEKFAVPEYWIVDEELEKVTLLRLGPAGYTEARPRKGILSSRVLSGFWLRPAWLWQQPRPKKAATLAEILAGPPG
jgi:Uma2 family endonuclease